jgi:hypothetical protein
MKVKFRWGDFQFFKKNITHAGIVMLTSMDYRFLKLI